jgi:four helix bundle protein
MQLVRKTYAISRTFPREETYALTSQLRRAAVSVPCNIAEGQGRRLDGEFTQFLGHARGSLMEVETLVLIARDLKYVGDEQSTELLSLASEVGKLINGLIDSLKSTKAAH